MRVSLPLLLTVLALGTVVGRPERGATEDPGAVASKGGDGDELLALKRGDGDELLALKRGDGDDLVA